MIKLNFKFLVYLVVLFQCLTAKAGAYDDYFRAINIDDARTVGALLRKGFDPNAVNEDGQVGLYLALRAGAPKVVDELLSHPDIKLDIENAAGETPIMMAALRGDVEAVRRLLDRGGRVNRSGWTALHYAASGPAVAVVQLLLDRGAELEARSPNGTTPLMMAARYGSDESTLLLLAKGADTRRKNDKALDAVDFARLGGREKLAVQLESARR